MLKDTYVTPKVEIVRFDVEDVITTSVELPQVPFAFSDDEYNKIFWGN